MGSALSTPLIVRAQAPTAETPVIGHAPPGHKPVYLPRPEYPQAASFVGLEGKVGVSVTVDENGNVSEAKIISGHPFFHSSSLKAASIAKFEPARLSGKPIRFRTLIVFSFKKPHNVNRRNLGIVNGRASKLPKPEYTQELKYLCASGEIGIQVLISEEGLVLESKAVFGDELLYDSALIAAKQATFRSVADAPPVRSSGILVYNFPSEKTCVDAGNVNEKWIKRPSFSVPPHARVTKAARISIRLGIEPFTGNVLAARATHGHRLIRKAFEKQALGIKFRPSFINSESYIVKGVITVTVLPNGKVEF